MTSQAEERERMTNLLAVLGLVSVLLLAVWWAVPDVRAGWLESARARASLAGQP